MGKRGMRMVAPWISLRARDRGGQKETAVLSRDRMAEEYLTINEVAERLKVKPKTIKNKMAAGIFRKGVHYFSPRGLGPRFKWSTVVAWLERGQEVRNDEEGIPMARGYILRQPSGD